MKVFILSGIFIFLCAFVQAELVLDFNYDLEKSVLSLNEEVAVVDNNEYMLVVYKNGISILRRESFKLDSLRTDALNFIAKKDDLLRVELWGDAGLVFFEEIIAGSNEMKENIKPEVIVEKPKSVLILDEIVPVKSVLVGDDNIISADMVDSIEIKAEAFGYEDKGNTTIGEEGFGYQVEPQQGEVQSYGHKNLGYESKDEVYGHKTLGYESKDELYGRKDY